MAPDHRRSQLLQWFQDWSGIPSVSLDVVSGDASFRRYFRSQGSEGSVVLVDSPPDKEKNYEFIAIAAALHSAGIRVPAVLKADLARGFMALEDFGDQLLLPLLSADSADDFYEQAMEMHRRLVFLNPGNLQLPCYDARELMREMDLFREWFCPQLLGLDWNSQSLDVYADLAGTLCARATAQGQGFVHRDFHARNLMVLEDGALAAIDFQDAILGPVTYDLVSLLKDCYVKWPRHRVCEWALAQRQALISEGLDLPDPDAFITDFDWMGLQRHIKVLGIFARLYLRDGKAVYLQDLPRVIGYVREVLELYRHEPAFSVFLTWFEEYVMPAAMRQDWYAGDAEL